MLKKFSLVRLITFCIIGAFGVIPNYFTFTFLSNFIHKGLAWLIGVIVGAVFNYMGNELWTFNKQPNKDNEVKKDGVSQ